MRICLFLFAATLAAQSPEQRAVDYLARETPRWFKDNSCFSCHNNGDAARALYVAARRGYKVPKEALAGTTAWLEQPARWDNNSGANPAIPGKPPGDKKLARVQFAAALGEAIESGFTGNRDAATLAAELLLRDQEQDGSWRIDVGAVGSPVTYGTALATYLARRSIESANSPRFASAMADATLWLLRNKPRTILEFSAAMLALPKEEPDVQSCAERLLAAQSPDGGWGPYPGSPTEPFDTAVALLALEKFNEPKRTAPAIAKARAFLISLQLPNGGWQETTRPPGNQSYAQHISTTAWATLALIGR